MKRNKTKRKVIKISQGTKNILNLSHIEARDFFIKHKSYCNFDLPPYIQFNKMLKNIDQALENKNPQDFQEQDPGKIESINHVIFHNKDGIYAWRPMQLIHPALYISLVHSITEEKNWKKIKERFKKFAKTSEKIECMSVPVVPSEKTKPLQEQIHHWWKKVEQESIKMSLSYDYLIHTDIANCYGSLYTHSIAWAIHGKREAKIDRGKNKKWIGNIIDKSLQQMSYGQTNGIPQGSALMDFIAEMVLGYIDTDLIKRIKTNKITDFHIIRYRDDYRIFANDLREGEMIIKFLSEILIDFGMTLNPKKTSPADQIIKGSIKNDKLYWMGEKQGACSLQKHLLLIHDLAMKFPNSGSLRKTLQKYYDRIENKKEIEDVYQLISIIVDIAYHNPTIYPSSTAITSKLISHIKENEEKKNIILQIKRKFNKIPNTGHLDIWLQRLVIGFNEKLSFGEPICKLVSHEEIPPIWNSKWLKQDFRKQVDNISIIDKEKLKEVKGKSIERDEFDVFPSNYY